MRSLVQITENGFIKSANAGDFSAHARGGKGVNGLGVTEKTGEVVGVLYVERVGDIVVATAKGKIVRFRCDEVRDTYTGGVGVNAVTLDDDDKVIGAVSIPDME